MVVKVRNRESSPCPTWRPELRTSWWPQMWQAEVSTSMTSPWSSTTTWPRTLRVSLTSFLSLYPLNLFPFRTVKWLYQGTSCFPCPFWGLIFNFAFLRLYPSYWPNGSCWKEWYGNDIPDQRRLFCVLRPETGHLRKPCVHLPARAGQSPRSPAQARHHPYQEEERGDYLCLSQTPHTCCCFFFFLYLVTAVSSHLILHKRHPVIHGIINHSFLTDKQVTSVELCDKTAVERNHPLTPSDGQLVKRNVEQHTSFVFYTLRVIVFLIFKLCKNTN